MKINNKYFKGTFLAIEIFIGVLIVIFIASFLSGCGSVTADSIADGGGGLGGSLSVSQGGSGGGDDTQAAGTTGQAAGTSGGSTVDAGGGGSGGMPAGGSTGAGGTSCYAPMWQLDLSHPNSGAAAAMAIDRSGPQTAAAFTSFSILPGGGGLGASDPVIDIATNFSASGLGGDNLPADIGQLWIPLGDCTFPQDLTGRTVSFHIDAPHQTAYVWISLAIFAEDANGVFSLTTPTYPVWDNSNGAGGESPVTATFTFTSAINQQINPLQQQVSQLVLQFSDHGGNAPWTTTGDIYVSDVIVY